MRHWNVTITIQSLRNHFKLQGSEIVINISQRRKSYYVIAIVVLRPITELLRAESNHYCSHYADYGGRNEDS